MRVRVSSMVAIALAVFVLAVGPTSTAYGQDQPIYGSQLMTQQERAEYQRRMRAATTEQEREQIRLEHHRQMQGPAREMGVELPDEPPAMGMGGQRMGPRPGAGSGAGMGSGSARVIPPRNALRATRRGSPFRPSSIAIGMAVRSGGCPSGSTIFGRRSAWQWIRCSTLAQ